MDRNLRSIRKPIFQSNQLVWASYKPAGDAVNFWPAVVLDPKEWKNIPKRLKPHSPDEKLIWWLRTNSDEAMFKTSVTNLYGFLQYFAKTCEENSTETEYKEAVMDAVQVVGLSREKNIYITGKNLRRTMLELAKTKTPVILTKKNQWQIVIPKNLHEELVDPYFSDSEKECIEGEMESSAESADDEEEIPAEQDNEAELSNDTTVSERMDIESTMPNLDIGKGTDDNACASTKASNKTDSAPICASELKAQSTAKKNYRCFLCPMKSPNMNDVLAHICMNHCPDKEQNSGVTYISCPYCPFKSSDEHVVDDHIHLHFDVANHIQLHFPSK